MINLCQKKLVSTGPGLQSGRLELLRSHPVMKTFGKLFENIKCDLRFLKKFLLIIQKIYRLNLKNENGGKSSIFQNFF